MSQIDLDWNRGAQKEQIERVSKRIAEAIVAFCRRRCSIGSDRFHMADLLAHVRREVGEVAPDSPGRILRQLRQRGEINYAVIDRAASEYQIRSVRAAR